jgi:hypothetical protein
MGKVAEKPGRIFTSSIKFDADRIRAAAIYCSDGRFGEQMDEFLHDGLKLPRYDRLALPGGPACFSGSLHSFWEGQSAERQLDFLCRVHQLERLVLIQHAGCAFYLDWLKVKPQDLENRQLEDLAKAVARTRHKQPNLAVSAHLARRDGDKIWFDPVSFTEAELKQRREAAETAARATQGSAARRG